MAGRYPEIVYTEEGMRAGLPPFEVDGDWPWNEEFFPKPPCIHESEPR